MKRNEKTSLSLSHIELEILDQIASKQRLSRSEVMRHLIVYQGLCGGDFPLTRKIYALPHDDLKRLLNEVVERYKRGESVKPQSFREWVKESAGSDDPAMQERCADAMLRRLLGD